MKMFHFLQIRLIACFVFALWAPPHGVGGGSISLAGKSHVTHRPSSPEVLRRMISTLGEAKAFTYRSRSIVEVPAKTGQFITLFSTAEVAVKRPDKLRARLTGEAPHFDFYFDGETASAFRSGDQGLFYGGGGAMARPSAGLTTSICSTAKFFTIAASLSKVPRETLLRRL